MKHSIFYNLAIACALTILLFSCNSPTQTEDPFTASPVLNQEENCEEDLWGTERSFDISVTAATAGSSHDFMAELPATPTYFPTDVCLCKLKTYEIEFESLPSANDIDIVTDNGVTVNFDGPFTTPNGEEIRIGEDYLESIIYITFYAGQTDPPATPVYRQSGGYCIVENLSGPKFDPAPAGSITTAWEETGYNSEGKERTDLYLPTTETLYINP